MGVLRTLFVSTHRRRMLGKERAGFASTFSQTKPQRNSSIFDVNTSRRSYKTGCRIHRPTLAISSGGTPISGSDQAGKAQGVILVRSIQNASRRKFFAA